MWTEPESEPLCTHFGSAFEQATSVTRFGEIPSLWQISTSLWQIGDSLFHILQNVDPILANWLHYWANVANFQILKNNLTIWSHCRQPWQGGLHHGERVRPLCPSGHLQSTRQVLVPLHRRQRSGGPKGHLQHRQLEQDQEPVPAGHDPGGQVYEQKKVVRCRVIKFIPVMTDIKYVWLYLAKTLTT